MSRITSFIPNPAAIAALAHSSDVGEAITEATVKVEGEAKNLAPVDTGRLRSSIGHDIRRDGRGVYGVVGTDVEYAPFVELGTRGRPGRSFLRAALKKVLG